MVADQMENEGEQLILLVIVLYEVMTCMTEEQLSEVYRLTRNEALTELLKRATHKQLLELHRVGVVDVEAEHVTLN